MPIRQSDYREFTGSTEVSPSNFNVFIHSCQPPYVHAEQQRHVYLCVRARRAYADIAIP